MNEQTKHNMRPAIGNSITDRVRIIEAQPAQTMASQTRRLEQAARQQPVRPPHETQAGFKL